MQLVVQINNRYVEVWKLSWLIINFYFWKNKLLSSRQVGLFDIPLRDYPIAFKKMAFSHNCGNANTMINGNMRTPLSPDQHQGKTYQDTKSSFFNGSCIRWEEMKHLLVTSKVVSGTQRSIVWKLSMVSLTRHFR